MEKQTTTLKPKIDLDLFLDDTIRNEFDIMLTFLSDIVNISDAFISMQCQQGQVIKSKIGLNYLNDPYSISCFNSFVYKNQNIAVEDSKKINNAEYEVLKTNGSNFTFFVGFPIKVNNLFIGSFCILSPDDIKLSSLEIKTIKNSVARIESMISISTQNKALQLKLERNKRKFISFEENSKEILFEINKKGLVTYVSKNWTSYIGHDVNQVIGKYYKEFIHPDDLTSFKDYLNTLQVDKKNTIDIVYRILSKNGNYIWLSSRLQLFEKDKLHYFIGNSTNISEFIDNEQKLAKQKDFYETILQNLPTDVVVFDVNHKYVYLNPIAIKNDELRKFIIGKDDFEYATYLGRDQTFALERRERFLSAIRNKAISFWEETLHTPQDGTTHHYRKFTPVFNLDGTFKMMIGFSVNITESKKIQEEIIQSRELIKNILNNTAVGIIVQGPEAEIINNNSAACQLLGLTQDQLLGKTKLNPFWKVIHEDGSTFTKEDQPVTLALKSLKPVNNIVMGVQRPLKKNIVWLLVDAVPVLGENKQLLYVICSFNEITKQKKTEEAIKISNERFKYVMEATSDVIWDWNIISDEITVGSNYSRKFGHRLKKKNGALMSIDCDAMVHPEDLKILNTKLEDILKNPTENKWAHEYRYLKSDGSYAFIKERGHILRDKTGAATRMIGAMTDLSLEKYLTDNLRQSEQQFKGAFEHSGLGMAIVDVNGYYLETNEKLTKILGYSKEELRNKTFMSLTHPDDLEEDLANKEKLDLGLVSNFSSEKRFINKNNSIVWTNLHVSAVINNKGEITYIPQIIDITDRKKIEIENEKLLEEVNRTRNNQLNEAKNMYRLLAENTIDLVCLHNLDATFKYVSPSVHNLLGYNPDELIGKSPLDFTHDEDIDILKERLDGFLSEQEDIAAQIRLRHSNGHYIWFESKAKLVKVDGIPISFHSGTREITAQKEAEESIKNALKKEKKLNDLRTNLVSTISHEFRTPMTTIRTSAELIEMYLDGQSIPNKDHLVKHLCTITNEIDRIVELMNTVLTISRDDAGKTNFQPTYFDLKQVCLNVIETSYSNQKDGRKVQTNIIGDKFPVLADKNLMEYSLFNILNNAFKYSVGSGDVLLNLFRDEKFVTIEITDKGIGIPKSDQKKLFNTFFRASNTNGIQGTGLGLYIVKTFIEKNSGSIYLKSNLGKGTVAFLKFPIKEQ